MSSSYAIRVEGLGKRYRLGRSAHSYQTFREALVQLLPRQHRPADASSFWALRNVSFEIPKGRVVGIIGRNGAGKSTLLKILSGITDPSEGEARICGSLGALLEVGTGFHPELTGRENVFLNGAILGFKKRELERRLDEIVAFAETERFLDTPVKRYSSGMLMRLAFAVAAHLEPDILLVDEVLAVGDARFQKKCLGKMESVGKDGRTVLFVSHNMPTVLRLCQEALLLENGRFSKSGSPQSVISEYLKSDSGGTAAREWESPQSAPGDEVVRLHSVRVRDSEGKVADSVDIRSPISIEVEYWNQQSTLRLTAILQFIDENGICLFTSNEFNSPLWRSKSLAPGLVKVRCNIPGNFLAEGRIYVMAGVGSYNPDVLHAWERDAVAFQVIDQSTGDGVRGEYGGSWDGVVRPMLEWEL